MPLALGADSAILANGEFTFRPLAVPSRGSTELSVWTIEVAAGGASDVHSASREEVFLVSAGSLTAEIAGDPLIAGVGDAIIVPPGVEFRLVNSGSGRAVATVITSKDIQGTVGGVVITPPWAQ